MKKEKKRQVMNIGLGILVGALVATSFNFATATIAKATYANYKIDFLGKAVTLTSAPVAVQKKGSASTTVYTPLKETLEALGMKVVYDNSTKTYTVTPAMVKGQSGAMGSVPSGGPAGGMAATDTSSITRKWMDVAYASKSSAQKLDLYLPNTGEGPFPVIVMIHGGAFKSGDKAGELGALTTALERGYAVASVNYRLSGEAIFPAQINDIKAAIRFLRANAATYKLNGDKIATWGGSAGGSLSALAATSGGVKALQDESLGNPGVSDTIQAAVDWFGPIYFSTMDAEFSKLGQTPAMGATSAASSPESAYLGKTVGTPEAEALVKLASAQTHITKDDPALYIQHGTMDRNIPITQSENFAKALSAVISQDKVIYEVIEGAGHGGAQFNEAANLKKIFDFLDKHLK